jgi:hypothetical protein
MKKNVIATKKKESRQKWKTAKKGWNAVPEIYRFPGTQIPGCFSTSSQRKQYRDIMTESISLKTIPRMDFQARHTQ